tara:strand:- start:544 stop:744 length:201 start_codon:yes stop_codon:yes gene_type:complete
LNDFGKTALNALLIIVGDIALAFLQSVNQTFVLENYANAFIVVIPAILVMVYPQSGLHIAEFGRQK